ncbi:hypothetical protein [Salinirubrum litoreum]|uniref:Transcriptional regulator n=1 Tax=Salinirubrum litoreum TaxID=1126234 RepID=A0ABD5R8A2_9EURY|nr:hypothetical protein [Salinirubrum litoreum]
MPPTGVVSDMDLNRIAKRIHNVSPRPIRLTFADGETGVFHFSSTEFFQTDFQGEATREGDDADYRVTTTEEGAGVVVGRKGPDDEGWSLVGEVVDAEAVES